nr:TetR family transcriptional regulator C-terminal domain-containing protein [uncultured Desulfobacter sp.]
MDNPIDKQPKSVRTRQKLATRQKLIDTTIELIAQGGLARVTLPRVAESAGLSRGICNYHFHTKELLLLDTFMTVYREHETAWKKALYDRDTPAPHRLKEFIRVLLVPPVADTNKVAVWMAFWGEAAGRRSYLDLYTARDKDFEKAVARVLCEIDPTPSHMNAMSPEDIAVALTGMIDGFWVQYLIAPGRLSPEHAISACIAYLSHFYPQMSPDI